MRTFWKAPSSRLANRAALALRHAMLSSTSIVEEVISNWQQNRDKEKVGQLGKGARYSSP